MKSLKQLESEVLRTLTVYYKHRRTARTHPRDQRLQRNADFYRRAARQALADLHNAELAAGCSL